MKLDGEVLAWTAVLWSSPRLDEPLSSRPGTTELKERSILRRCSRIYFEKKPTYSVFGAAHFR
jgi:hypothetical protein